MLQFIEIILLVFSFFTCSRCFPSKEKHHDVNTFIEKLIALANYAPPEHPSAEKPHENRHSITKKGGVLKDDQSSNVLKIEANFTQTIEDILESLLSSLSYKNEEESRHNISDATLIKVLNYITENIIQDEKPNPENEDFSYPYEGEKIQAMPSLQFLEPDLGPAVLPLQVPEGYFVPFIPRKAFGVTNGVSRPSHGHASFYKYRPRGLVDVRNSPAYGYLLGGSGL